MTKLLLKIKKNYVLVIILVVGALLRFYKIDFQSVWLDEIHTLNEANPSQSLKEVLMSVMMGEQIPPLYFYSVYFLFKIFGYTAIVLRIYSAVIGVVGIYALYVLGKSLVNRRVGLIAATLLCVNYFDLYYSQEGRPYIFLVLFSVFSIHRMAIFLKEPNRRNALLFGLFASLMVHCHFFGLFALLSQCFVLLFFLILCEKEKRKAFFFNCLLAGLLWIVLFIPALPLFINVTEIKSFWIPAPTPDSYTLIFKELFGNSEHLLAFVGLLLFFYFLMLFRKKDQSMTYAGIVGNKSLLTFVIVAPWLLLVVLIPLLRSYLSLPMLISRYFIIALPVILLLVAIAFSEIKNTVVRLTILSVFVIFSVTDIFVVKKYYTVLNKTQFREAGRFIRDNNTNNAPVNTSLHWYYTYFLNKDGKTNIVQADRNLETVITEMMQDSTKVKSFWYTDAHGRPYALSESAEKFLNEHFFIEKSYDGYDIWVRYYSPKPANFNALDLKSFTPLNAQNGGGIMFFRNEGTASPPINLQQGRYKIMFSGNSYPDIPINGENAHFTVKANGVNIGGFYIGSGDSVLSLDVPQAGSVVLEVAFDNDWAENGKDRNAIINAIYIFEDKK